MITEARGPSNSKSPIKPLFTNTSTGSPPVKMKHSLIVATEGQEDRKGDRKVVERCISYVWIDRQ
jgi:hypothetical protein